MALPTLPSLPPLTGDTSWIDNPTGMEGIPVPIAPARPSTSTSSTGASGSSSVWDTAKQNIKNAFDFSTYTSGSGDTLENIVFIVLGLMLIGIGILSLGAASAFGQGLVEGARDEIKKKGVKGAVKAAVVA